MTSHALSEKKARAWDRWVTIFIVIALSLPIPFARFESWPQGGTILVRPVLPWSRFQFCYVRFPENDAVEEAYYFTWKGKILPADNSSPLLLVPTSAEPPVLKWQKNPELTLSEVFQQGNFVQVKTFWQPILLWPFAMLVMKPA